MKFLKSISYQQQHFLGLALGILGIALARACQIGILANLGFAVYPLLFILNPLAPPSYQLTDKVREQTRIASAVFLIIIVLTDFGFLLN